MVAFISCVLVRLWDKEKRLERRRRATCYIRKSHLPPEPSRVLKCAQDDLPQGSLRGCGPNGCKVLSARPPGLPVLSHSLRGKNSETRWWSSGVRGNGSRQHEASALQPLATFLDVEPGTMWLSQSKSHLSDGDK